MAIRERNYVTKIMLTMVSPMVDDDVVKKIKENVTIEWVHIFFPLSACPFSCLVIIFIFEAPVIIALRFWRVCVFCVYVDERMQR